MSHNGVEGARETPPHRARHQIGRSISELSSPIRLHRHHSHHRAAKEKEKEKEKERDGRVQAPQATPMPQGRLSLDGSRSDGLTPSPDPSRRTSILLAADEAQAAMPGATITNGPSITKVHLEDVLWKERQKAMARERFASPSPSGKSTSLT